MGQLLNADAIHIREQAKIDAARITTKSGNERRGAESTLANFSQSLSNMRNMRAGGEAFNDAQGNIARAAEAASVGPLKMRLAAAEELGSTAAMAASAGVGGGSVDMYNETVRLTSAMQEQGFAENVETAEWAERKSAGNVVSSSVLSLDNNIYRANLDYTQYVDHKKPSMFERLVTVGLAAGATVVGGPQAGMAVVGAFEARQAARNGDFAGSDQALMGAFQNTVGAVKSYQATKPGKVATNTPQVSHDGPTWGQPGHEGTPFGHPSVGFDWKPSNTLGNIILK